MTIRVHGKMGKMCLCGGIGIERSLTLIFDCQQISPKTKEEAVINNKREKSIPLGKEKQRAEEEGAAFFIRTFCRLYTFNEEKNQEHLLLKIGKQKRKDTLIQGPCSVLTCSVYVSLIIPVQFLLSEDSPRILQNHVPTATFSHELALLMKPVSLI